MFLKPTSTRVSGSHYFADRESATNDFLRSLFCTISYFNQSSTELPHLLCWFLQTCSQTKLCIRENEINPPYLVHLHPWTHGMSFQTFCPLLDIQNSFPISSGVSIFHLFFYKERKKHYQWLRFLFYNYILHNALLKPDRKSDPLSNFSCVFCTQRVIQSIKWKHHTHYSLGLLKWLW